MQRGGVPGDPGRTPRPLGAARPEGPAARGGAADPRRARAARARPRRGARRALGRRRLTAPRREP